MLCGKCAGEISGLSGHGHAGLILCEDCYIDAVSVLKTCDPWAVYSATRTVSKGESLTVIQKRILELIQAKTPRTLEEICHELTLSEQEFRSNFSTLRHMELTQACKKEGQVYYVLFTKQSVCQ